MNIREGSIREAAVKQLLVEHHQSMFAFSPPESVHALSEDEFFDSALTLWCAWEDDALMGCGALKRLDSIHGEIKSMRTADEFRRRGVAAGILTHIIETAEQEGYGRLSLETGSHEFFSPARALYQRFGFASCEPFGSYVEDPHSVFMSIEISSNESGR